MFLYERQVRRVLLQCSPHIHAGAHSLEILSCGLLSLSNLTCCKLQRIALAVFPTPCLLVTIIHLRLTSSQAMHRAP